MNRIRIATISATILTSWGISGCLKKGESADSGNALSETHQVSATESSTAPSKMPDLGVETTICGEQVLIPKGSGPVGTDGVKILLEGRERVSPIYPKELEARNGDRGFICVKGIARQGFEGISFNVSSVSLEPKIILGSTEELMEFVKVGAGDLNEKEFSFSFDQIIERPGTYEFVLSVNSNSNMDLFLRRDAPITFSIPNGYDSAGNIQFIGKDEKTEIVIHQKTTLHIRITCLLGGGKWKLYARRVK